MKNKRSTSMMKIAALGASVAAALSGVAACGDTESSDPDRKSVV